MLRDNLKLMLVALIVFGVLSAGEVSVSAEEGNIIGKDKVGIVNPNQYIDSKYVITPEFNKDTRLVMLGSGYKFNKDNRGRDVIVEPSKKADIRALYTNVAEYKGEKLDLEFRVVDWEEENRFTGGFYMMFFKNNIAFQHGGYKHITIDARYKKKNGQDADIPGSYMNIIDFDFNQFVSFTNGTYRHVDEMYVYDNTRVSLWSKNGKTNIGARFWDGLDPSDKEGHVLFLLNGNNFRFDWAKDWDRPNSSGKPHRFNRPINWKKTGNAQYFEYTPDKPMPTKPVDPEKRIRVGNEDKESNTLDNLKDTINYVVYHTVPRDREEFYYKGYKLTDELHPALTVNSKDIKIYNSLGKSVKGQFDVNVKTETRSNGEKVDVVTATAKNPKRASFHDEYYRFEIPAKLRSPEYVIETLGMTGNETIKNRAGIRIKSIDTNTYNTNEVSTNLTIPEDNNSKKVKVEKVWKGDHELDRPKEITVNLFADQKKVDSVTLSEKNNWKHTFDNLKMFNEDWSKVNYTVKEENVKDYKTDIEVLTDETDEKSFKITNTWDYTPLKPPELTKEVEGKSEHVAKLNDPFEFSVYAKVPEILRGYHSLTIKDNLDDRFKLLDAKLLVDGKFTGKPTIKGQEVIQVFDRYDLEKYKNSEIELLITAEIKPDLIIEPIENKGVIQPNNETSVYSNPVHVKPHPIEVGFKKIRIYTDKENNGLPVKLDFNVKELNTEYLNEKFNVNIYRIDEKGRFKVKTDTVKVANADKTLEMIIPSEFLKKDEVVTYEAIIEGYNSSYVLPIDGEGKIDSDGYTSTEETIKVDLEELGDDVTEYKYSNVIKTEREINKGMKKYYEEFTFPIERVGRQKSGYGVKFDRQVYYTNDLNLTNDIKAGLFVEEDLFKVRDTSLVDTTIDYPVEGGYQYRELESTKSFLPATNHKRVEKYSYWLPNVYVERHSGTQFNDPNTYSGKGVVNGGNKLYIPIWIDELGEYELSFNSIEPTGIHQINFEIKDKLDVYAYMYAHIDSDTIKEDEILIRPANFRGLFSSELPEDWTDEDIEWLKE